MENIYFDYNGKTYSGYIISYTAPDALYLWFVFNEEEMSALFGETVAFYVREGELLPVYHYTSKASFIEYLRKKIEAVLPLN